MVRGGETRQRRRRRAAAALWPVAAAVGLLAVLVVTADLRETSAAPGPEPTTTTIVRTLPNPSLLGALVTIDATVTTPSGEHPPGWVTFNVSGSNLGAPVWLDGTTGNATIVTGAIPAGSRQITATFTSNVARFENSTSAPFSHIVRVVTTTAVTSTPNPSALGSTARLTATVTSVSASDGPRPNPTGSVTFSDGATTLGTVFLTATGLGSGASQAMLNTTALAAGSRSITASYTPTLTFIESTSFAHVHQVDIPTSTVVTSTPNPSLLGGPATITATVTSPGPTPTGTVAFFDGGSPLGTVALDPSGQASLSVSALAAGPRPITASFSPAATGVLASTSTSHTHHVDVPTETVVAASPPSPSAVGDPVSFTATVTASPATAGPVTAGAVTFSTDALSSLTIDVDPTTGRATFTTADLPAGSHTITATYAADDTFAASAGETVHEVEVVAVPTVRLTNDGPIPEGTAGTVTFVDLFDPSSGELAVLRFSYDFDDDGEFEIVGSTEPSATVPASYLPDGPAAYTIRGAIDDGRGGVTELTTVIDVTNTAPQTMIGAPATAIAGAPVTIELGAVDPSPFDMQGTFTYRFDWGDGTAPRTLDGPALQGVTHTYTDSGTFRFTATATDRVGDTGDPQTHTIVVNAPAAITGTPVLTPTTPSPGQPVEPGATTPGATTPGATPGASGTPVTTTPNGMLPQTGDVDTAALTAFATLAILAGLAALMLSRPGRRCADSPGRR